MGCNDILAKGMQLGRCIFVYQGTRKQCYPDKINKFLKDVVSIPGVSVT